MVERRWLIPLLFLFAAVLAAVPIATSQDTAPTEAALAQAGIYTDVYEAVSPSVVAISVVARNPNTSRFGQDNQIIAGGSGFVIDQEGHIVTNNHVVEGATRIEVNFRDGTLARADVVGLDPNSDVAVLQVDLPSERLFPIEWGDSDTLVIGEPVLAIGSPFGQRWTLTSGIVSALERTIPGLTDFSIGGVIQTDASINPGNSGGPLLDIEGRVIGVNTQIATASGSSSGVGFAVPSNLTRRVAQELIQQGFVDYSYLGIGGSDVTLSIIEALNLPNDTRGVVVGSVSPNSPAGNAGLQEPDNFADVDGLEVPTSMDIITAINGEPLSGIGDLISYLARNTEPGDTVTLTVLRDGTEQLDLDVRLTPRP